MTGLLLAIPERDAAPLRGIALIATDCRAQPKRCQLLLLKVKRPSAVPVVVVLARTALQGARITLRRQVVRYTSR